MTRISKQSITICSPSGGLQTRLLAKIIARETGATCDNYTSLSCLEEEPGLLLIDCEGYDNDTLRDMAQALNNQANTTIAALFNAEQGSDHEDLLDWPCISGLFYIDSDEEQLVRGLKSMLDGDYWVPRRLLHHFMDKNRRPPVQIKRPRAKLTKREKQILQHIHDGATNSEIAHSLDVSEHTVKSHLYNVYKKIGVRNRIEAGNWVRDLNESLDEL